MNVRQLLLLMGWMVISLAGATLARAATTYYVWSDNPNPQPPHTNWAQAATTIQAAVDLTVAGDTILVSNGVYDVGGVINWPADTILTNRVAITNAIVVRSANNDPTNTIIMGAGPPGPEAVRCVYMVNQASLIGFTLANGATLATGTTDRNGGGVLCQSVSCVISNCIFSGNTAFNEGGGAYQGTLYNCLLQGNTGKYGGGANRSVLTNCTLIENYGSSRGGGMEWGTAYNCAFITNWAFSYGGGISGVTMYNCSLISNQAQYAGGALNSTLYNCIVSHNRAFRAGYATAGGGIQGGTLYNCLLVNNSTPGDGGGAHGANLYNCTIAGNSAATGGGVYGGQAINSIVYFNAAATNGSNWYDTVLFTNSCTAPAAAGDAWPVGNIAENPLFVNAGDGNYRLRMNSPCVNAGTNLSWITESSVDLDGAPRLRYEFVDMGAYETLIIQGSVLTVW